MVYLVVGGSQSCASRDWKWSACLLVLCERVEGSLNTEEVLTGLRINSPTGIPECGADALRSTLCSTSFKKPSPQTMSGGGCVLR
ncbi:uncharacterized protein LOC135100907 isoform X3 [Scylla paramamosain]|uniref:uncharacterized protein LOC135100907 isoform X3 n=1 Tax=Scylla paramamosain TaxID=85552 RepID=UPI003082CD5F